MALNLKTYSSGLGIGLGTSVGHGYGYTVAAGAMLGTTLMVIGVAAVVAGVVGYAMRKKAKAKGVKN